MGQREATVGWGGYEFTVQRESPVPSGWRDELSVRGPFEAFGDSDQERVFGTIQLDGRTHVGESGWLPPKLRNPQARSKMHRALSDIADLLGLTGVHKVMSHMRVDQAARRALGL
jgi:hypothetical protein